MVCVCVSRRDEPDLIHLHKLCLSSMLAISNVNQAVGPFIFI